MQRDMGGVEGRGPGLVVDVVSIGGVDPQAAWALRSGAERPQLYPPVPLAFQPGDELAQIERDGSSSSRIMAACRPFALTRSITYID